MVDVPEHKRRVAFHVLTGGTPREGVLKARRYREEKEQSTWFTAVDFLLGDDEYIFLSLYPLSEERFRYTFDAEELIQMGAGIRTGDIMKTDEYKALDREYREVSFSEHKKGNKLLPMNFIDMKQLEDLLHRYPEFSRRFEILRQIKDHTTFWGDTAIRVLHSCPVVPEGCELLVPKELPLSKALSSGYGLREVQITG